MERFIKDTLEKEGRRMLKNQGDAIYVAYKKHSGRLMSERRISVPGGNNPALEFDHPIYERFLDLKKKRNIDRRIHNRFVYGTFTAIQRTLRWYTEEEIAQLFFRDESGWGSNE